MKTLRDVRIGDAVYALLPVVKMLHKYVITHIDTDDDVTRFYYGNNMWEYFLFLNSELDSLPSNMFLSVEDLIKHLNENI